ncbi:MAG: AlbA family DNA-binding domain-containing protein, partial [Planctomycetota bacterium]
HKGIKQSSILAATVFSLPANGSTYVIATETDAAAFFDGLQKYAENHLFLLSDSSDTLPHQFSFTTGNKPEIVETNDPIILTAYTQWKKNAPEKLETVYSFTFDGQSWWISVRRLEIKDRELYSGYILPESKLLSKFHIVRRIIAGISAISFTIVLIATIFLWRRFQRDIAQSALPPAVNEMTDNDVLRAIAAGEDDRLEFKSTLRWNLHTNKPDKAMEIACLKTMAAFLNSEGGTLLVGVEDNGNILGVAADQFPNEDKFLLHFNNLINQHLGLETAGSFSFDIRHLESGDIMIIDCQPSPAPVYVTHDRKEEFYVRVGPGTRPLTTRDALEYIRNHF